MAERESKPELGGLARSTTATLAGSAASTLLMLGLLFVLTRGLGLGHAGILLSTIALFQVIAVSASLGVETGLIRWISGREDLSSRPSHSRLLTVALIPVLVISGLAAVATLALSPAIGNLIGDGRLSPVATSTIRAVAAFIPVAALSSGLLGATRGYGTMTPTVFVDRVGRPALQLLLVLVAVLAGSGASVVAVSWALPYLIQLALGGWWLTRLHRKHPTRDLDGAGIRDTALQFWAFTLPRALSSTFRVTYQWFDVVLVAGLASPEDAAIYAVATRLLLPGILAAFSIGQAVEPRFGRFAAAGDDVLTRHLYSTTTGWLILLTWPYYIVAGMFAPALLAIFGVGFEAGATAVIVLALSAMFGAGMGPVDILLVMKGKSTWSLWNTALALGINIGLNILLIPRLGIVGAALSLAISRVVANVLPMLQLRNLANLHPFGRSWVVATGAALIIFGTASLLTRLIWGPNLWSAVVASLVAVIPYGAVLWRSRSTLGLDPSFVSLRQGIA